MKKKDVGSVRIYYSKSSLGYGLKERWPGDTGYSTNLPRYSTKEQAEKAKENTLESMRRCAE